MMRITYGRQPQVDANGRRKRRSDLPRRSLAGLQPESSTVSPRMYDSDIPPNAQRRDDGPDEKDSSTESESDDPMSPLVDRQYWKKKGLILGRCVEMWDTFYQIIDEGASRDPDVDEDSTRTDLAGEQAGPELSLELDKVRQGYPYCMCIGAGGAAQKCRQGSVDATQASSGGSEAHDSRKQARRGDINGIRGAIGLWPCIDWQPAFPIARHLLGFNHRTSGRLLCPVTLNWADDSVRDALRHGTQNVTAANHPAFLWPQDVFTLDDIYKGFLRGPVLLMAYKYIFISPSSARETDRSTRGGNASLHDVTFVTYESVAYVATVTRFALSNEPAFGPGGRDNNIQVGGFPYRAFYREILEHKELMLEDELVSLLLYWNEKIFPRSIYSSDDVRNDSAGAIMREQARARRLADEAAANAAMVMAEEEEGSESETPFAASD
ncbi:hypothetical protein EDB84DRAFT_1437712 [Lactarius hengduanensis]|nr:hypothetical protein EDB84DRAFT_1437712 [Lactarius hengduanensis]